MSNKPKPKTAEPKRLYPTVAEIREIKRLAREYGIGKENEPTALANSAVAEDFCVMCKSQIERETAQKIIHRLNQAQSLKELGKLFDALAKEVLGRVALNSVPKKDLE